MTNTTDYQRVAELTAEEAIGIALDIRVSHEAEIIKANFAAMLCPDNPSQGEAVANLIVRMIDGVCGNPLLEEYDDSQQYTDYAKRCLREGEEAIRRISSAADQSNPNQSTEVPQ